MLIAHILTVHAKFSIGLVGPQQHEMQGVFNALVRTLANLKDPIVLTSANTFFSPVPDDSAATLKFKYLGAKSANFADQTDFAVSAKLHLDCGIFECPEILVTDMNGTFLSLCYYFVRIEDKRPLGAAPIVH